MMTDKFPPANCPPSAAEQADALCHSAFYKFTRLAHPEVVAAHLRRLTVELSGSILVAREGINGVVAGSAAALDRFEHELSGESTFEACFAGMVFKRSACETKPFARIKVHCRNEIVAFGVQGIDVASAAATAVSPQAWRELLAQDDVVVIDNRNSFEYRLGRFKSAIDPGVDNFRDFPNYVEAHASGWKAGRKRVAMYCTGGIRCEKSAEWMRRLGLEVYQLEGGILNYFQSMPDAEREWEGECFVFDNRIALDTKLRETGTTLEGVYAAEPKSAWRLERARRLDAAVEHAGHDPTL
jgi:UPF0176 protein